MTFIPLHETASIATLIPLHKWSIIQSPFYKWECDQLDIFQKRGTSPHTTIALVEGEIEHSPLTLRLHQMFWWITRSDGLVRGCGDGNARSARDILVHSRHWFVHFRELFLSHWPRSFSTLSAPTPAGFCSLHHRQLPRLTDHLHAVQKEGTWSELLSSIFHWQKFKN